MSKAGVRFHGGLLSTIFAGLLCSRLVSQAASQVVIWATVPNIDAVVTNVPPDLTNAVAVVAGSFFSLALKADGTVIGWGESGPTANEINVPTGLSNVIAVAAEPDNCIALRSDGTVVGWGSSNDNVGQTNVPIGLTNVVAVAVGVVHSLALKSDGSLVTWGSDAFGQTNIPPALTNVVAIGASMYHSMALRADGKVIVWGAIVPAITNVPLDLTNAVAIAGSASESTSHSLALRADGTVTSWGYNQAPVPIGLTNVIAIAAGESQDSALKADGTVAVWGSTNLPSGLSNVAQVASGFSHSLALLGDGPPFLTSALLNRSIGYGMTTWLYASATGAWPLSYQWRFDGTNILGATNAILTLSNVTFAQGGMYSVVVSNAFGIVVSAEMTLSVLPVLITVPPQSQVIVEGSTVTFAPQFSGQPPLSYQWQFNGTNIVGATNSTLVLTGLQWYQSGLYSVVVSNALGTVQSSAAVLTVTQVTAWGNNDYGQTNLLPNLTNVIAIACGYYHNLFLRSDGTVSAQGLNLYGQTNVPPDLTNVIAIAAGSVHSMALKKDGTVVAWGYDIYGQTNVPPALSNVVAIAGGGYHCLALKVDGTVIAWGYNNAGQTNVPPGLSNVVAIAAGSDFSLVLKGDGTITNWGDDLGGEIELLEASSNVVAIAADDYHCMLLMGGGTLTEAGGYFQDGNIGSESIISFVPNCIAITAGGSHDMALVSDGTVVAWGYDGSGETNVPVGLTNVFGISAGYRYSLALARSGQPISQTPLTGLVVGTNTFSCSLPTQSGRVYALEYKNSLSDANWTALPLTAGTGFPVTLSDPTATNSSRYYRVQRW